MGVVTHISGTQLCTCVAHCSAGSSPMYLWACRDADGVGGTGAQVRWWACAGGDSFILGPTFM